MSKRVPVLLLIAIVATSVAVGYLVFRSPGNHEVQAERYSVAPHAPITIGSDSDFTEASAESGCQCVRSGTGQELNPYLISDWIVNSTESDGIAISGTKAYFTIARVLLEGASPNRGIYIEEAENVIVEQCRITGWWYGLYTFQSSNIQLINNTVTRNHYGIQLEASDNNKLIGNRFDSNEEIGIFLRGSNDILLNNTVTRNNFGGINVDGTTGSAYSNQLTGNVVLENQVYGIGIWRGHNNTLTANTVERNKTVGIMLTDHSTNNLIEANTVSGNGSGITLIDGSSGNTVRQNIVKGNGDGVNGFDLYDSSGGNTWVGNTYDTREPSSID
jgi:parallel beta-helix repeat protein